MRFALPACKFEGLHLCHRFFYDLMSLVEAISQNVAKEEIKINCEKDPEGIYSRVPQEALKSLPQLRSALIQSKGTLTNN